MRPLRPSLRAASLAAVLLAALARGESATTRDRARLRQGPSGATEQLGDVPPGTSVELLGENGGWRQVRTPEGRVGWLWAEHFVPKEPEARPAAPGAGVRTLADEVRDLRGEVSALRQRPDPATGVDIERLRQELERVATAERDLARRLDERVGPAPVDPAPEGVGGVAPAWLAVGAVIGFVGSRLLHGRRERRQRNRLRL